MLTPQEVSDKTFKQAFVGGYDMPSVDEFLEKLTEDYTNLYKENAVLKSKMKVLVEKLEEYRSNEDSIRQAYLAIRSQAEKELEDARAERERILCEAQEKARRFTGDLDGLIAKEEKRLTVTREQTASFIEILKECYHRQIEQLDVIMTASMDDSPQKKHDDAVRKTAAEIEASISALRATPEPEMPPEMEMEMTAVFSPQEPVVHPVMQEAPAVNPEPEMRQTLWASQETPAEAPAMQPEAQPAAQPAVQPDNEKPAPPLTDEDLIYSIQQSLTATFNVNEEVDWTPEEISEIRRPSFDFSSLPDNFGHKEKPDKKRGRFGKDK